MVARQRETTPCSGPQRARRLAAPACQGLGLALLFALSAGAPKPKPACDVPLRAQPGFDATTFDPLVAVGIAVGAYPGIAVLVVGRRDSVLFARGYGHLTWARTSPVPNPDSTLYDLASLTKVVATTTAVMLLVDRGRVRLDAPVATYVPAFDGPGTGGITVRELLTHTSGLRPTLPLFRQPDRAAALRVVHAAAPVVPPGTRVIYSDLNGILLGEIVERVTGEPLDQFVAREVWAPLGLRRTLFRPPSPRCGAEIAPTGEWHGRPVGGVVNDQNAARLGGVLGPRGPVRDRVGPRALRSVHPPRRHRARRSPAGPSCHAGHVPDPGHTAQTRNPGRAAGARVAGGAHGRGRLERGHALRAPLDRAHRLDGNVVVDRSGSGLVRGAANESGVRPSYRATVYPVEGSARPGGGRRGRGV